jgi:hypothetical protein
MKNTAITPPDTKKVATSPQPHIGKWSKAKMVVAVSPAHH